MGRKKTVYISSNKYKYRQKNNKNQEIEKGRKTTVQIFQVTNINIERKTIKTMKQK